MNKSKVLIVTNSLKERCEAVLKENFEVYSPGDPKVALIWTKPGPDVIIAEMPKFDAIGYTKALREAGYEGLIFVVLDQKTIDDKFRLDCKAYHLTGVFDINTIPAKIAEGIVTTLKLLANPAYLSFSLN